MSSQCVKQMSVCGEGGAAGGGVGGGEEVTGIIHLVNKFLTIGWNRRITSFPDLPDVRAGQVYVCKARWKREWTVLINPTYAHYQSSSELPEGNLFHHSSPCFRYSMSGKTAAGKERTTTRWGTDSTQHLLQIN